MRPFCYADDLVDVILTMLEGPALDSPVNIGSPEEFTVRELACEVTHATESFSKINFLPLPKDDVAQRRPDSARAIALYTWQPRISLQQEVRRCIPDFGQITAVKSPSGCSLKIRPQGAYT